MFIIFLEISGFNEYLEAFNNDDVKQNLSVLESSHILTINKLKYYIN